MMKSEKRIAPQTDIRPFKALGRHTHASGLSGMVQMIEHVRQIDSGRVQKNYRVQVWCEEHGVVTLRKGRTFV